MQKNTAAAAGHPRAGIVVDLDDEIVEMIVPPQPVTWFSGRAAQRAVIAPIDGIFAPGKVRSDPPDGQEGPRRGGAPPPPTTGERAETAPAAWHRRLRTCWHGRPRDRAR